MNQLLVDAYNAANSDTRIAGREWYSDARAQVRDIAETFGIEHGIVAGVMSALSPRLRWWRNVLGTERMIEAWYNDVQEAPEGLTIYQFNAEKAWRILTRDLTLDEAFRPDTKTYNFYRNLIGDEQSVTIDTWMIKALGLDSHRGLSQRRYRMYREQIADIAKEVGEIPAQFQAIVWIATRGQAR